MEYVDEQHQEEHLKKLFKEYGPPVLGGIIVAIAILLGWQYYQAHKEHVAQQASMQYMQVLNQVQAQQSQAAQKQARSLMKNYPSTQYAALSALLLSRYHNQDQHYAAAAKKLKWAIGHTSMPMLQSIAHIRLARVRLQQGKQKQALKQLKQVSSSAFAGLANEVKGDVYASQKHNQQAYQAYQKAQQQLSGKSYGALLPMKIANLPVTAVQSQQG